jgi:peptidoglycan/LPS O-acetylase OafA/YrhL
MGLLRVLLALFVACAHVRPIASDVSIWVSGGAVFAVKAFFVISGFYMTLVLDGRYRSRSVGEFYLSRALRILPAYWAVCLVVVAVEYLFIPRGEYLHPLASPIAYGHDFRLANLEPGMAAYVLTSLTTLFGLDTGQWIGFDRYDGKLLWPPDYGPYALSVAAICPIPQAWTIGIELVFYVLAPFIVHRSVAVLLALCVASLAFRLMLAHFGFSGQPWNRALFPSELIYFLGGVLGYRLFQRLPDWKTRPAVCAPVAVVLMIVVLAYGPITNHSGGGLLLDTVPFMLIALALPFLFQLTRDSVLDARIGELSYPIYLVHFLAMGMLMWSPLAKLDSWAWLAVNMAGVIALAILLDLFVARPVDQFRTRFGARPAAVEAKALA